MQARGLGNFIVNFGILSGKINVSRWQWLRFPADALGFFFSFTNVDEKKDLWCSSTV